MASLRSTFDEIASLSQDADQMFRRAAQRLATSGEFHRLFDLRLLQSRYDLGVPLDSQTALDDFEEPVRAQLEQGYLAACREVGQLLLEAGEARAAWTYLRPAGEKTNVRKWLERALPDDERADELIDLAFYEKIDSERGFAWLLARRGICNAITELESIASHLPVADLAACAAVLVRHVHDEVLSNVQAHLQKLEKDSPNDRSLAAILTRYPDLLDEGAYHVDLSHLATTVRYARTLVELSSLQLALDLAVYGEKLDESLKTSDAPPFEDLYTTHRSFFGAILGQDIDCAVDYFCKRAHDVDVDQHGSGAIETYLILLDRIDRPGEAMQQYAKVVPTGCSLSPSAPTLLQLAQRSGQWDRYAEICQQRDDLIGFAAGQLARHLNTLET